MYRAERKAAERLLALMKFSPGSVGALREEIESIETAVGISYGELQKKALETAAMKGVMILTGGPGTGKTTTLKGIISLFKKRGLHIALAAPTGRAAKRMTEVTGMEAKTIHRLLEVEWGDGKPARRDLQPHRRRRDYSRRLQWLTLALSNLGRFPCCAHLRKTDQPRRSGSPARPTIPG